MSSRSSRPTPQHRRVFLTDAQLRVLERLAAGDTYSRIAAALYVSPTTVRSHVAALQRHFGVKTNVCIVLAAVVVGVLSADVWPVTLTGTADFDPTDLLPTYE